MKQRFTCATLISITFQIGWQQDVYIGLVAKADGMTGGDVYKFSEYGYKAHGLVCSSVCSCPTWIPRDIPGVVWPDVEGRLSLQSGPLCVPENLSFPFKEGSGSARGRHFAESRPSVLANSMTPSCVRELSEDPGDRSEWLRGLETLPAVLATCFDFRVPWNCSSHSRLCSWW